MLPAWWILGSAAVLLLDGLLVVNIFYWANARDY
jgi:hypothetical protein